MCLWSLTKDAVERGLLGATRLKTHCIDETVQRVPLRRIFRLHRRRQKVIVALAGVQTNQFPRAVDLARAFRREKIPVLIGGFHVSGTLAMLPAPPADMEELMREGITLVKGEVEESWPHLLSDALEDRLKPLYDFLEQKPDLSKAPLPSISRGYLRRFIASNFGTVDCGRGCPFNCSFCSIINVQGRTMRFRSTSNLIGVIRENYLRNGINYYFFTDDNFARNPLWEEIFDALVELRQREGIAIRFMMQVDVSSHKIKNFVAKSRQAGCTQVFIGMESLNSDNLVNAGKRQNKVSDYPALIECYRSAGIATHVGYILGFPFDSPESIQTDLDRLMQEVKVDQVSFFILIPLPGSRDYVEAVASGRRMDPDFNNYDGMHETFAHPLFRPGQLLESYDRAWETFYNFENMKAILNRCDRRNYWNIFHNFIWYKKAAIVEKRHPMMSGFIRLKGRHDRRPGVPIAGFCEYWKQRCRETFRSAKALTRLILEMQVLWAQTCPSRPFDQLIYREIETVKGQLHLGIRLAEIQAAYRRLHSQLPGVRVPSRFRLLVRRYNPMIRKGKFYSWDEIQHFWGDKVSEIKCRPFSFPLWWQTFRRLWLDLVLAVHFGFAILRAKAT